MNKAIIMEHVKKCFGDKTVLKDISFSIQKGEVFGLLGPSGSGKTTIMNILTGQIKKTDGNAYILGCNTDNLTSDIYEGIGMVLDRASLFERLSCYRNLAIFAEIHNIEKKQIHKILEMVNLEDQTKTRAYQLSKGMRQRLAIARALIHKPNILFLDEPTNGLDPSNVQNIHDVILSLHKQGVTVFLTTHKMDEAAKLCDNIAIINHGIIMEYGVPSEICRKYNHDNSIDIKLKDGREIKLDNSDEASDTIISLIKNRQIETIHSSEPDLESVFLSVTEESEDNNEIEKN